MTMKMVIWPFSKEVLAEFRRLTEGRVVWNRREKAWITLEPGEDYEGRSLE